MWLIDVCCKLRISLIATLKVLAMTPHPEMKRTQIYLHATQQSALANMAQSLQSTSSALIRQSIDLFLKSRTPAAQRDRRLQTAGKWSNDAGSFDTSALRQLRNEERQF